MFCGQAQHCQASQESLHAPCAAHPGQRRRTAKLTMPPSCTASRPAQGGTRPVGETLGWCGDPSSWWRRQGSESCTRLTLGEHPLSPLPTVKVLGHKSCHLSSSSWQGGVDLPDDPQALPFAVPPPPSPDSRMENINKIEKIYELDTLEAKKKTPQVRRKKIDRDSKEQEDEGSKKTTSRVEEVRKKLEEDEMPYLQVPGPEAVQNHLPVPRLMVFGSEGSSPSSSSSWGRRGASPEPVGKESRGQGAKGAKGL